MSLDVEQTLTNLHTMLKSFGEECLDEKQQIVKHWVLEWEHIFLVTC